MKKKVNMFAVKWVDFQLLFMLKKKKKKNYLSTTCGCKQKLNKRDGKRKKEGRILYKQLLFLDRRRLFLPMREGRGGGEEEKS